MGDLKNKIEKLKKELKDQSEVLKNFLIYDPDKKKNLKNVTKRKGFE